MTRRLTAAAAGLTILAAFAASAGTLDAAVADPTGGIKGRVTDAATGQPVARAAVAAQLIEGPQRSARGAGARPSPTIKAGSPSTGSSRGSTTW